MPSARRVMPGPYTRRARCEKLRALGRPPPPTRETPMSEQSTPVDDRIFQYIESHTTGEDAFLAQLKTEARKTGLPAIWISPGQAAFLQILLRAVRARTVVEVGTLAGYSAIA